MATITTGTTPRPTPTPSSPEEDGIFLSYYSLGYVEPSGKRLASIEHAFRQLAKGRITREFLNNLLTIKLLLPEESSDLVIVGLDSVKTAVSRLAHTATFRYIQQPRRT